jgi:hypothetical protein
MLLSLSKETVIMTSAALFAIAVPAVLAAVLCDPADAQMPPSYGLDFVTVGSPGNRPANAQEAPLLYQLHNPPRLVGAVGYEYRITRTTVTVGQWFEFVEAYAPYWQGAPGDVLFTSIWVDWTGGGYRMKPGSENHPASATWRLAARYANWLHNGKVNERWAFEDGAYDTSTFTQNPNGSFNDQAKHSPGAKFWIPTNDEWAKAVHYDPDRYGPGQEGYWLYPHGKDEEPVPGYPWAGGETNTALFSLPVQPAPHFDVNAYPHVTSPWGLLGVSGGEWEWMEDFSTGHTVRLTRTSSFKSSGPFPRDRLDLESFGNPRLAAHGFRIASVIPAPSTLGGVIGILVFFAQRRRP